MTADAGPGRYGHLEFNSPVAPWRADRLVAALAGGSPATIVDIGCGWGELLLRLASVVLGAKCWGVDADTELLERGRAGAAERGLEGRVEFVEYQGREWTRTADLVVCVGAAHVFGTSAQALEALASLVAPGGRLLFGDGFWERVPTEAELASMWPGTTASDQLLLPDLVDAAIGAGLRPVRIETVDRGEWEDFESGMQADKELWLLDHPGSSQAERVREQADRNREWWLRGHRGLLGFAYVTLGRPVA